MHGKDLIAYLWGSREAIERIAASRSAIVIGALLVLTAGIARNYDHLDLLRQPEWFIGPFAASLFSTCFVYLWVWAALALFRHRKFFAQLKTFLVLFWMTAPCAWLYGLPMEQWSGDLLLATKWNVAFLAIVSIWRVALIVRAVSVLSDVRWWAVLPAVLVPASIEMWFGSLWKRMSLVGIMGGVRLSPSHEYLVKAQEFTIQASQWTLAGSIVALLIVVMRKQRAQTSLCRPRGEGVTCAVWGATAVSLVAWILMSIPSQSKVRNRAALEKLCDQEQHTEAAAFASTMERKDFPATHFLPPDPYRYETPIELLDTLDTGVPSWLKEEWMTNARLSYCHHVPDQRLPWEEIAQRHPWVLDAMQKQAQEWKSGSRELNDDERNWLRYYEEVIAPRLVRKPAITQ